MSFNKKLILILVASAATNFNLYPESAGTLKI